MGQWVGFKNAAQIPTLSGGYVVNGDGPCPYFHCFSIYNDLATGAQSQLGIDLETRDLYTRTNLYGSWSGWTKMIHKIGADAKDFGFVDSDNMKVTAVDSNGNGGQIIFHHEGGNPLGVRLCKNGIWQSEIRLG